MPEMTEDKVIGTRKSMRESLGVPPAALRTDSERSVIARSFGASKPPPLKFEPINRRQSISNAADPERPLTPIKSRKRQDSISSAAGDNFDRHVSDVLQTLPSRIRFSSRPANSTATPQSAKSKSSRPADLTLAPAQVDSNKASSSPRHGDTKLYHLSTPGKADPLKLFVRLVGENERVMVRVGGGWMDLADFLRQYAEHHGTRTLASSGVEINEAPSSGSKLPMTKTRSTPLSRPGSVLDTYSPRPDSALAKRSSGSTITSMKTPDLSSSPFVGNSSPAYVLTPTMSRPGTGENGDVDIGLGLTGRKQGELDEGRQKWVDEMIHRTKAASAEKKRNGERERQWSDVGKAGSMGRVAFKGGAGGN